jgi:hypothetical protein
MLLKFPSSVSVAFSSVALLIGAALLIYSSLHKREHLHYHHLLNEPEDESLKYGKIFPDLKGTDLIGTIRLRDRLHGYWTYLIQTGGYQTPNLDYAKILLNKYNGKRLQFIYLFPTKPAPLAPAFGNVQHLMAYWSSDQKYPERTWTTLIDPSGVIRFSLPYSLSSEALRELTERYILGQINYAPPADTKLPLGSVLPPIELVRVIDSQRTTLPLLAGRNSTVIFFQAHCTTCSVDHFLAKLQKINSGRVSLSERHIYPIFSRSFDIKQLRVNGINFGNNLFIAADFFPQSEDEYYVGPGSSKDPVVFSTGRTGRIVRIEEFSTWEKHQ